MNQSPKKPTNSSLSVDPAYGQWLKQLKEKVRSTQLRASLAVNTEMLQFYWELGADIISKQKQATWGDGFLTRLSQDLMTEFPEIKGFSKRNLEQIRKWYRFWNTIPAFAKQPATQFFSIPWWHHIVILTKCSMPQEAVYYVAQTIEHGWSRTVLTHHIESKLWQRDGKAITNFAESLAPSQSELATQLLKDPYVFDFMSLGKEHTERELEQALVQHITQFLLELGTGFAYVGKQLPLQVGEREFFLDLLFYHTRLHCYVVIELKTVEFEPEHAGKLNFYIKAVDAQYRSKDDHPTIGLLLCKNKDRIVAEYALSDIHKPMGISEYQLTNTLPQNLKNSLPSIEELEAQLGLSEGEL